MWGDIRRSPSTGIEGMIGGIGTVFQLERGRAKVFYHGEIWDAVTKEPIIMGEEVEIVGFDEMKLLVRRKV
jgi:membrane-bound serine protease (ClpP class)